MNWRKHIAYPLICYKNGNHELAYLRKLEKMQYSTQGELVAYQLAKFQELLTDVGRQVPYYQTLRVDEYEMKTLDDIRKLPLLGKRVMQEEYKRLFSQKYTSTQLLLDKTGGSTGEPTKFAYTRDRFDLRRAAEMRHDSWAGYDIGDKCAIIWGARRDFGSSPSLKARLRKFVTTRHLILDSSSLTDEGCLEYLTRFNTFRPKVILAYAQSLLYVAQFIHERSLHVHSPAAIITSSELLSDQDRAYIEMVFNSPVFNRYGTRETSVIASECEEHVMHIHDEGIYVEILRADGSVCDDGEEGEVVITDLLNDAFPLIRYRIGDVGMKLGTQCSCGRGLSTFKITSGRVSDFIITPTGRKVSGAAITAYVCTNIPGLSKAQFYQMDKDTVTVKVVGNREFTSETVRALDARIRSFLDNIEPTIERVESIPLVSSGKHQFVINEMLRGKSD